MIRSLSILFIFAFAIALLSWARHEQGPLSEVATYGSIQDSKLISAMQAGMLPSFFSDLSVLKIFSSFHKFSSSASPKARQVYSQHALASFHEAQFLDPFFLDIYRLAEGVLAYEFNMPKEAVTILEKGSLQLNEWGIPFIASFIAYNQLKDPKKAILLARRASQKKGVPPLIIDYTSKLMNDSLGIDFSIRFLEERKKALPADYSNALNKRIEKLRKEKNEP